MSQHICHVRFLPQPLGKNFLVFMEILVFETKSGNLCLHSTQICQVHTNKCASLFYFIESCFFQSNNTLLVGTEKHIHLFAAMTSVFVAVHFLLERCDVKTCFHGLTFQIKGTKIIIGLWPFSIEKKKCL